MRSNECSIQDTLEYPESSLQQYKKIVAVTDRKNWEHYVETEQETMLNFLENGVLSQSY